jgi:hypothetical protein
MTLGDLVVHISEYLLEAGDQPKQMADLLKALSEFCKARARFFEIMSLYPTERAVSQAAQWAALAKVLGRIATLTKI